MNSDAQFRTECARRAEVRKRLATLSPRERQVVDLIAAGKELNGIAAKLGTKYNTVRNQRLAILKKLKASSDIEVVALVRFAGTE